MNITFQLTLLVILLIQFHSNNAELYCRDEHGDNVDWYIVYKLPKISEPLLNSTFGEGLRYAYIAGPAIGAKNAIKEWQLSSKEVGDRNSIFAKTLRPVYKEPKKFTSLLYNDDPAEAESTKSYIDSANSYWAHAKGVVAMDSETGFFITHSIPRFPLAFNESKYEYPSSASNYGQTALCISFKTPSEANKILRHLQTLQPNIYYSNDANVLKDKSVFNDVIGKVALNETLAIRTIKSYNGKLFTAFGKNSKADGDLYGAYIAPYLKNDLSVQTWRRGAGEPLPSNCTSAYKILNVNTLEMKFKSGIIQTTEEWSYTQDHAKWAVTQTSYSTFVCVADINRMESQFNRGGGSLCMNDSDVWRQFKDLIQSVEECRK